MYMLSALAVLHIALEAKPGENRYFWYVLIVSVLLAHRVLVSQIKCF